MGHGSRIAAALLAVAVLLAGCGPAPDPAAPPAGPTGPRPSETTPGQGSGVQPRGEPVALWEGLAAPWSVLRAGGVVLVGERDSGRVLELLPGGASRLLGTIPVHHAAESEGGLLGLAALVEDDAEPWLYAYTTTERDNRILRMPLLLPDGGTPSLGQAETVLDGLPAAWNHNGGRIAFGPDGMLYATAGDAAEPDRAQDLSSLGGKILRMTPEGGVPADNPFPGSLVYSYGHRNPQGIAWDAEGRLWAAEFGQSSWDEFNRIEAGGNYGWPVVEGAGGDPRYIDPVAQWPTEEASPSGLAFIEGSFFLAALRGERIWSIRVDPDSGEAETAAWYAGEYGRIRQVLEGPEGSLWFVTNNTDSRGSPRPGDDRVYQVGLVRR